MWGLICLLAGCVLILGVTSSDLFHRPGRGVCLANTHSAPKLSYTESYVQPVYQPYLKACEGQRVCSSYRTAYKVAYRQGFRMVSAPLYACCPGWKRVSSQTHACSKGICGLPCHHGGVCAGTNRCGCPLGWGGKYCHTDIDECNSESHGCSQDCVNTAGSYRCGCRNGYALTVDGKTCTIVDKAPQSSMAPAMNSSASETSDNTKNEMQELKTRMEALEQKMQLLLAPLNTLFPSTSDFVRTDPMRILSHSFQQLDRIDSLSEQISFLEERLETCSCKNQR